MAEHKYSNTTTADLWEALETAAGKPVKNVAASWTEQPGFPLIKVKTHCINDRQVVSLEQTRFLIGEPDRTPLQWSVPVGIVSVGEPAKVRRVLLDKLSSDFDFSLCEEPIKGNAGDVGFFRWNRLLPNLTAGFTESERAEELVRFAKQNLPAQGQREAHNAANLIRFRAELKTRELPKIDLWISTKVSQISVSAQSN